MGFKWSLDPSVPKALIVGVLLFVITFVTGLQTITITGAMPTEAQLLTILCGAIAAAVTYMLGFLGYEKKEKK